MQGYVGTRRTPGITVGIACAAVFCLFFISVLIFRKHGQNSRDQVHEEPGIAKQSQETQPSAMERPPLVIVTIKPEVTDIDGWGRNVSRDTITYLDPFNDTTIIPGKKICGNQTNQDNKALVIIVTTSPSHFSKRALIRRTWASRKVRHVKIGFLVGVTTNRSVQVSLEQESEKFQDIIQENIIDTYNNLTLKSIALLKWYIQNCPKSPLLMKSDDDTFVNIELLVIYLAKYPLTGVLTGYLCSKCGVIRTADSSWSVPRYMYPNRIYPDFLFGNAYIMSRDVATKLFAAALKTPIFYLEDVFITGFCAREAGVKPQPFGGSSPYVKRAFLTTLCRPRHSMCHPISPEDMEHLWKTRKGIPNLTKL